MYLCSNRYWRKLMVKNNKELPLLEEWSRALFIEWLGKKEEMEKTQKRDYGAFV